ncbi:Ig-like domain-containing protein [Anaerovorax odorimutans]|uniref:Ig-like domain-containing protein n=1 Tax=Anaerovorax odorimutans TaxID=109327 RepID=UPI00041D8028|nr:Ig-like domain-containing protein [Anaerovorax odorimutans]
MKSLIFVCKKLGFFNLSYIRKFFAAFMAVTLLVALLWSADINEVRAVCGSTGLPSDTLTIKVGYFGGPYYTKKVYTITDFDKLPQVQQAYTYIDNLPAICVDSAEGVKLSDLLEDAGIDINSIQKLYFYSTDIENGWYQCLDKTYLFDTPRYYYPNLPSKWNYDTQSAPPEAIAGAVQVDTIMAYKDNWQRYADTPDFSNFDTSTRFRLLFGQVGTNEHNASMSAKWVHSIEVMLGGMPPSNISLDQNNINLKVGSTLQLTATVAPDDATEKSVNWSSSDTDVATVDKNGVVSVVGDGTATITVSTVVGDIAATCIINGPKNSSKAGITTAGTDGSKKDAQEVSGEQLKLIEKIDSPKKDDNSSSKEEKKDLSESKLLTAVNSTKISSDKQGGIQPWRIYEMSADAVPLQKQKESKIPSICIAAIFIMLFTAGAVKKYLIYLREN